MQSVSPPPVTARQPATQPAQEASRKPWLLIVLGLAVATVILSYVTRLVPEQASGIAEIPAMPAAAGEVATPIIDWRETPPNDVMAILASCRQAFSEMPNEPWQYVWNPNFNAAVCVYQKNGVWYPDKFAEGADFDFFVVAPLIVDCDQAGNILGPVEYVTP